MAVIERVHDVSGPSVRIDRVVQELTGCSRSGVRGLFDRGCVFRGGDLCSEAGSLVSAGERVTVRYDPRQNYRERPRRREGSGYRLIFEDNDLLVVEKSAFLLTVPTDRGETNTLVDLLSGYLNRRGHRGRLAIVQRLDRGTSGVLAFGKNPRAGRALQRQLRERKAGREYKAIVAGKLLRDRGTFSSKLATAKSLRRYSVDERGAGETAVTHFEVEARLKGATVVRARLETGRRNQIRVHFAEAGHPVLGDDRYRPDLAHHPLWKTRRLALHAAVLEFDHPATGKRLRFVSPLPAEFERFLHEGR